MELNVLIMCSRGYGKTYSAVNTKSEYIALGLQQAGCAVRILDSVRGIVGVNLCVEQISPAGINYVMFPEVLHHNLLPNLTLYKNLLIKYRQDNRLNHIIIGMEYMPIFVYLAKCAKRVGYSTSTLFHEWHIGIQTKGILKSMHKYWQDLCFGYYIDAILPISHFLLQKSARFNKPTMLLPVLGYFDKQLGGKIENRFTYCADAGYLLRNQLILHAFKTIHDEYPLVKLVLVLFGREIDLEKVRYLVRDMNILPNVIILTQISQEELSHIYASSIGLFMPLDPNSQQDVARFSQKIAEYLTSGRPMITSNVGEIPFYFEDCCNALIADYTPNAYAEKMRALVDNPTLGVTIGLKGYEVGKMNFDYRKNGEMLKSFLINTFANGK